MGNPWGLTLKNFEQLYGRDADFYAGDKTWRMYLDDLEITVCWYLDGRWDCEITEPDLEYFACYDAESSQEAIDGAVFNCINGIYE